MTRRRLSGRFGSDDTRVTLTLRVSQFDGLLSADARTPDTAVASDGLAQIVYTSGTEALPLMSCLTITDSASAATKPTFATIRTAVRIDDDP